MQVCNKVTFNMFTVTVY